MSELKHKVIWPCCPPRGWRLDVASSHSDGIVLRVPRYILARMLGLAALLPLVIAYLEWLGWVPGDGPRFLAGGGLMVCVAIGLAAGAVVAALWKRRVVVPADAHLRVVPMECHVGLSSLPPEQWPGTSKPRTRGLALVRWDPPSIEVLCYRRNVPEMDAEAAECRRVGMHIERDDTILVMGGSWTPWF